MVNGLGEVWEAETWSGFKQELEIAAIPQRATE